MINEVLRNQELLIKDLNKAKAEENQQSAFNFFKEIEEKYKILIDEGMRPINERLMEEAQKSKGFGVATILQMIMGIMFFVTIISNFV